MRVMASVAAGFVLFGSGFLGSCHSSRHTHNPAAVTETTVVHGTTLITRCRTVTANDGRFNVTCGTTLTNKR
jgi:hypothetical protein